MEKLDKVLQKEVNSNKKLSKNFIQFLKDRNKDCKLYDDSIKGIENRGNYKGLCSSDLR